jgi:HPt (histidine-containing phosphotransfer) domain-containing protein
MNGYLPKPFAPEELFSNLRHFLSPENGNPGPVIQPGVATSETYNLSYIKEMDDPAYTAEVLEIFLETTPVALSDLKKCSLAENWPEVAKAAHKLKSSVGLMQMKAMLTNVEKVEVFAIKNQNLNEIPQLVKHIAGQYELIRPMLEAELEEAKKEIGSL